MGNVRAAQTSLIASQMMGNIVEIRVHEGDRVRRGQVLAVIDDAQPRANLDRATAAELASGKEISAADSDYALAEATYKRYQTLLDRKSVSPQEFDEVKARYEGAQARRDMARAGQSQAKAALDQARTAAGYSRVLAPFDGVVTEKKADVGTLASPGMPLFTVMGGLASLDATVEPPRFEQFVWNIRHELAHDKHAEGGQQPEEEPVHEIAQRAQQGALAHALLAARRHGAGQHGCAGRGPDLDFGHVAPAVTTAGDRYGICPAGRAEREGVRPGGIVGTQKAPLSRLLRMPAVHGCPLWGVPLPGRRGQYVA